MRPGVAGIELDRLAGFSLRLRPCPCAKQMKSSQHGVCESQIRVQLQGLRGVLPNPPTCHDRRIIPKKATQIRQGKLRVAGGDLRVFHDRQVQLLNALRAIAVCGQEMGAPFDVVTVSGKVEYGCWMPPLLWPYVEPEGQRISNLPCQRLLQG